MSPQNVDVKEHGLYLCYSKEDPHKNQNVCEGPVEKASGIYISYEHLKIQLMMVRVACGLELQGEAD